ncbi:MAG: M48 family metallopeptidase [Ignavibacteriales bacterium]|nr:M48 family metallopeptidase [Ignavibacteriales bacterium]
MNTYALIILFALLAEYFLDFISNILNLSSLAKDLPKEFENVYDAEKYKKSQEYTRAKTKFEFLTSTFNIVITLIFWFSGGFNYVDKIILAWNLHFLWNGLLFAGILLFVKSVLDLPFGIYSTFVIEERFGFNKTTVKTFILDLVKGVLLGIVLGAPLFAGILAFFFYTGENAWLYCWLVATVFILFVQFIAPTWIMPLFNKFTPLQEGELREKIFSLGKKLKFPLNEIYVMDGSKRSSKSNAFFTGFGKNKRIALFDTLIAKHTTDELVAVLAHEIGHYKKKHIQVGMVLSIVHTGVMFFLLSKFLSDKNLFDAFYMEHQSIYAGMIFFGMLFTPIEFFVSLGMQILSRKNEFEADKFAKENIERNDDMITALKKLSVDNLSNLTPHPLYVFFHYSHPSVLERIRAIQNKSK